MKNTKKGGKFGSNHLDSKRLALRSAYRCLQSRYVVPIESTFQHLGQQYVLVNRQF